MFLDTGSTPVYSIICAKEGPAGSVGGFLSAYYAKSIRIVFWILMALLHYLESLKILDYQAFRKKKTSKTTLLGHFRLFGGKIGDSNSIKM